MKLEDEARLFLEISVQSWIVIGLVLVFQIV